MDESSIGAGAWTGIGIVDPGRDAEDAEARVAETGVETEAEGSKSV